MIKYKFTFTKSEKADIFCREVAKIEALEDTKIIKDKVVYTVGFDSKKDIPPIVYYAKTDRDVYVERVKSLQDIFEDLLQDYYPNYGLDLTEESTIRELISETMKQNGVNVYTIISPFSSDGVWVISWLVENKSELEIETFVFHEELLEN